MHAQLPAIFIVLPILGLIFPLIHAGGPFTTSSFQVFGLWMLVLSIGYFWHGFTAKRMIPLRLPRPLLFLFGSLGSLIFLVLYHGDFNELVWWVGPVLLLVVLISIPLYLWIFQLTQERFGNVTRVLSLALSLCGAVLIFLSWPGEAFLDLGWVSNIGEVVYPLTYGGLNHQNLFASFVVSIAAFTLLSARARPDLVCFASSTFLFIALVTVFWTGSRIGILAFLALFGFWLLVYVVERNFKQAASLLFVFISAYVGHLIVLNLSSTDSASALSAVGALGSGEDQAVGIRMYLLKASWFLGLSEPLLGNGLRSFQIMLPDAFQLYDEIRLSYDYVGLTRHPHNEIAYWWFAGGLFGLLAVVLPVVFGVVALAGFSFVGLQRLTLFIPILFHSMTEYPLHQSAVHWFLIALFLSWIAFARNEEVQDAKKTSIVFDSVTLRQFICIGLSVLLLTASLVSAQASIVGHNRLANLLQIEGEVSAQRYIQTRSDDPELQHWAYKEADGWLWTRSVFQLAMGEGNGPYVKQLLPQMKLAMRYLNNKPSWALYAGALAGLGKKAELIGFIDYIEKLDPKYAKGMRQAYGL